jgi:glycosyltransferase involved in cell wall biosynthesis
LFQQARVAVIVPCYNESRLVGRALARLPAWVDTVIAVDDASTDGTAEAIVSARDSRITLVQHATNQGVGAAIRTGYRVALEQRADVLAVMAGDDQMDPVDLPTVIMPVVTGAADYVKGNRFRHREAANMPLLRRLGSGLLSAATRLASGLSIDDTQCGFTALSAATARHLPLDSLWPRFGYPNDLLLLLAARGLRVHEVPVRPVYADEKSGLRPWHILQILGVIARRSWQERALQSRRADVRAQIVTPNVNRLLP